MIRASLIVLIAAAILSAAAVRAQQPNRPPRDVRPPLSQPLPTTVIAGRITAADSGAPIRRAQVVAISPETMDPRRPESGHNTVVADDEGRYELRLEPGAWRLTASKVGYATQQFGQRRPFDAAEVITITGNTPRLSADFALVRASVIAGRIYDEYGDPLAAIRVHVMRSRMVQRRRYLERIGEGDLTDDTGAFRIYGLTPGEYYVAASLRVAPPESVIQTTYAPTYYPGTGNLAEARRVLLEPGAELNVDFPLLPYRTARLSGVVLTANGSPASAFLNLASEAGELGVPLGIGGVTQPDGTFTLPEVPPGSYTLNATLRGDVGVGAEAGAIPLSVYGDDIGGLTLVTAKPGTLRGAVVADDGVTRRLPETLNIVARSRRASGEATFTDAVRNAFAFAVPAGPFHLEIEAPEGWMVKAILVANVDASDGVIDVRSEQDVPVRIVLTDRVTEVSGTVAGGPVRRPPTIVVFPDDSSRWAPPSRYVRTVTADQGGRFRIAGLPPGPRYLAAAIDVVEEGEGDDPDFLARVRPVATAFTLGEGERRALDLGLIQR